MSKLASAVANTLSVAAEHHAADRARFSTMLESLFYNPREAAIRRGTRVLLSTVMDARTWRGSVADQ